MNNKEAIKRISMMIANLINDSSCGDLDEDLEETAMQDIDALEMAVEALVTCMEDEE